MQKSQNLDLYIALSKLLSFSFLIFFFKFGKDKGRQKKNIFLFERKFRIKRI